MRGSRGERVQRTKQRRRGWRSAPVFASTMQVRGKNRLSARGIRLHPGQLPDEATWEDVCYCPREGYKVASVSSATRQVLITVSYCPREGYKVASSIDSDKPDREMVLLSP